MEIKKYVESLRGVINKSDVLSALDSVVQDLGTKVQPLVDTSAAAFGTIKLKSPEVISYEDRYRGTMKLGRNDNVFADVQRRLQQVSKNMTVLRTLIERNLPESVSSSAIDYRSAVLLQLVDNASFMMRFIRRFIETSVIYETEQYGIYDDYAKNNINRGEVAWVTNRLPFFIITLEALSTDSKEFEKKYDAIPNVRVDADAASDIPLFGRDKMDPFKLGFIPLAINPFFRIGRMVVEFQAWRYKEAQEDLMRIQKRIMLLEEAHSGKSNPKIEKEIDILRDKAETLTYRINKAEEEL